MTEAPKNEEFEVFEPKPGQEFGTQPIDKLIEEFGLKNHDLVEAYQNETGKQLTHKIVKKARNGRRLTFKTRQKVTIALNLALQNNETYLEQTVSDLFNYKA